VTKIGIFTKNAHFIDIYNQPDPGGSDLARPVAQKNSGYTLIISNLNQQAMHFKSFYTGTNQTHSLNSLLQEIVRIADPEKILLISASFQYQLTENVFQRSPVKQFLGNRYELLILLNVREKGELAKQELNLMNRIIYPGDFQFATMDIIEFNKEVESGSPYLDQILLNALMSYDKGVIPFAQPAMQV
jgi:hypothetical protein